MDYSIVKHILEMEELFHDLIDYSSNNINFYDDKLFKINTRFCHNDHKPNVCVKDYTTTEAIIKCRLIADTVKICALNFANFLTPGGGYLTGCHAQEETICGDSTLYNILNRNSNWYDVNADSVNGGLFANRAMYIPRVMFTNSMFAKCDILTVAAPDVNMCKTNYREAQVHDTLVKRIKFIKDILEIEGVSIAILGAFGCGAFRNDSYEVASIFKDVFSNTSISNILYAVPTFGNRDKTSHYIFKEIMEKE